MDSGFSTSALLVLIVEDHVDTAESMAVLLRFHGHEVFIAHNRAEALDALKIAPPDVILMDIGLPGDDGYKVTGALLPRLKRKPLLVAITGYCDLAQQSRRAGFHNHFEKPIDPEQLADLLRVYADKLMKPVLTRR
jgi:CheY-like chemotaxis protein